MARQWHEYRKTVQVSEVIVEAAGVEAASSIGVLPAFGSGLATYRADSVTLSGAVWRDIVMVLRDAAKSDKRAGELLSELERKGVARLPILCGSQGHSK